MPAVTMRLCLALPLCIACCVAVQRHWTWNNMDQSFRDHTTQLGDLHHFAWRANHPNETVYYSDRDGARYVSECL